MELVVVQIEMLWIIPIFSFTVFIGLVIFFAQKKTLQTDLKKEVISFNSGEAVRIVSHKNPDVRLEELEKAISGVTNSITTQQKVLDRFKRENNECTSEINDLKDKLRDLYKEYDIVLSENYSLRAKMKKLLGSKTSDDSTLSNVNPDNEIEQIQNQNDENGKMDYDMPSSGNVNLKLYEDTRLLNVTSLENFENTRSRSNE